MLDADIPLLFIWWLRTEHVSNFLTSSVPVIISLLVYLKVQFFHHYTFCSISTIWTPHLPMMQL